jgi:DNA-binding CsgD family transcriptional regulator
VSPRRSRRPGQLLESRTLAGELGALLDRLEIDAVLTDRAGIALATTQQAKRHEAPVPRRVHELRLNGRGLCVAVAAGGAHVAEPGASLTPRQREVAALLLEGLPNREIAQRLGISLHTVRRHVESVLSRLTVPTRGSAALLLRGVENT